jgi:hypothetical protein
MGLGDKTTRLYSRISVLTVLFLTTMSLQSPVLTSVLLLLVMSLMLICRPQPRPQTEDLV